MRQLEGTPNAEAISLDGIDITYAWRVDAERPIMESTLDWLEEEIVEGVAAVEEEEEQEEEEMTPLTMVTSRGCGQPPLPPSFSTSRAQQIPLHIMSHLEL